MNAYISLIVATNRYFRGIKKLPKIRYFDTILLMQKRWSATKVNDAFLINLEQLYLLQLCISWNWVHTFHCTVSLKKCTTMVLLEVKEPTSSTFFMLLFLSKTEECDQSNWFLSNNFRTIIPSSAAHFLNVSAHVSLKKATKWFL